MGLKTAMVVIAAADPAAGLRAGPTAEVAGARALAAALFPGRVGRPVGERELAEVALPEEDTVYAATFPGGGIVCCQEFAGCSQDLSARIVGTAAGRQAYLHAMHSVAGILVFCHWSGGEVVRSLVVVPAEGFAAETGERYAFELPYWPEGAGSAGGADTAGAASPPPRGGIELGGVMATRLFGFGVPGDPAIGSVDPLDAMVTGFRLAPTPAGGA